MAEVVKMPRLSDTMTEGVLVKWNKKVGDPVKSGDILAEIETDKATMEFESFFDGELLHIGLKEGATAPVESLIAIIGKKGEDIESLIASASAIAPKEDAPKEEAPQATASVAEVAESTPSTSTTSDLEIKASPLAKKLALEKGIDIHNVKGSAPNGRIIKQDILSAEKSGGSAPISAAFSGTVQFEDKPLTQMRKTIAKRLADSKFSAPHFYLRVKVDMDNVIRARKKINEVSNQKISFNDIVLKAVAMALKQHPVINASWMNDKIRYNQHVNIGVAVAIEDGLLVPVVRFADGKPLSAISAEVKDLVGLAKSKKLQPKDWEGSTFTISNLGMYGIEDFTAIINPPDACILAVGGIQQVPVVKNGEVVPGNVMTLTLSCDHRVVDGASGAEFLNTLKGMLEEPLLLLV